ncbi:VF530 family DNA-binding protein [Niabella sp. CJ426]|uniref:VF530 family protein n=2 Tax=unclassified Niabella TaxID=2646634 RepID=UPI003CFCC9CE
MFRLSIRTPIYLSLLLLKKMEHTSKDPLHGKRLDTILEELVAYYQGFEKLGEQIRIKCFTDNPSISSSLKFLRKTPWARTKVESLYLYVLRQQKKAAKGHQ